MNTFDDARTSKIIEEIMFPKLEYRSVKKDYTISKNVKPELCAKCGGKCCKRCGCHFSPDDFKEISFEALEKEMEKGYISIDYVDGEMILSNFGVYILRIRNQGAPIVDIGYERAPCILLTDNGCKLDYAHRPSGGKLLIPETETRCHTSYGITKCCYEWRPYQRILYDLFKYFADKDILCSL